MRKRIFILSSLVCALGATAAIASECTDGTCYEPEYESADVVETSWFDYDAPALTTAPTAEPIVTESETSWFDFDAPVATNPTPVAQPIVTNSNLVPMRNVKMLSIKPTPIDDRAPLWDGTNGNYKPQTYPKTVSWKNGIPLWDDSISDYTKKDFRDWMLEDLPELYIRDADNVNDVELVELYNDTMTQAADTRARIEELLAPNRPSPNLWVDKTPCPNDTTQSIYAPNPIYTAQDLSVPIRTAFGGDGCPFETETECNIWRRKPIIRETVSPRSHKIREDKMIEFISEIQTTGNVDASSPAATPLIERYRMLMRSATACCTEGMKYSLRKAGASDGLIYKFMSDDANFYNIGERCLMMSDEELDEKYPETATASVIADVRNGCLCRGRQWFTAMLAPFIDAWNASPEFAQSKFLWSYTDGLQRMVTVSINDDVQNVLDQISECP